MTWMLWKALRSPQWKHPIFRYARQESHRRKPFPAYAYALGFLFGLAFAGFAAFFPIFALLSLFALGLGIPALIFIFNGTFLGMFWANSIAETIAREARTGRSDLLSLTPEGAFSANWRLAMGVIHRHDWLNTVYRLLRNTVLIVLALLFFATLMLFGGLFFPSIAAERAGQLRILLDILGIMLALLFFWADHVQSILIALLLALILPFYQRSEALLKLIAPLSFLLLQCLTYLLGYALYFAAHSLIKEMSFLVSCLVLIIFCSFREWLLRGLWQHYRSLTEASEETIIVQS